MNVNSPDGRAFGGPKAAAGTGCQRCGFPVYEAEKMISKNRHWHKRCFSCFECHKSLDSTNLCDAPDNEIYCRGCYGHHFGPKGVGFGMGAGCLSMVWKNNTPNRKSNPIFIWFCFIFTISFHLFCHKIKCFSYILRMIVGVIYKYIF